MSAVTAINMLLHIRETAAQGKPLARDDARYFIAAVDEWLRFRAGGGRRSLVIKAILGVFWFYIAYIFRFVLTLLVVQRPGDLARWARHLALRDRTLAWAVERGLEAPAAAPWRSPTVTTLRAPAGRGGAEVVRALATRGFTVGGGYGEWKPDTFRIGHMGEILPGDLEGLLAALDDIL